MANATIDTLRQAISLLHDVAATPTFSLSDEDVCALTVAIEDAGRLIDAARVATSAEIEQRSRFELGSAGLSYRLGHRRGVHLVEQLTRVSQAEAARRIRIGESLHARVGVGGEVLPAHFPHVAEAVTSGSIGLDAAAAITRCLGQAVTSGAALSEVEAAEQELVTEARSVCADNVAIMARVWREALDPDGALPREEKLRAQRRFVLGHERDGAFPFHGVATGLEAAELHAYFSESAAPDASPRFLSQEDLERADDALPDPRTREQRQFDIVMGLLRAGVRSTGQRSTATVMAVIKLDDLEARRGVGWLDSVSEPVSASAVNELVCDSGFRKLVLGPHGEVLELGRTERSFSRSQRLALAARDGGCIWPQCTAPPSWCHAHHVKEWSEGGKTDVDNGALLCAAHHHMLHASEFEMKMIEGRPHLLAPPWLDPAQEWKTLGHPRLAWRLAA